MSEVENTVNANVDGQNNEIADVNKTDGVQKQDAVSDDLETDNEGDQPDDAPDGDTDKELKTVRKALDKRNRYINNQRNRIRSLEAEIEKIKSSFAKNEIKPPDENAYESVLDLYDAKQDYKIEKRLAEQAQKAQLAALEQQQNMAIQQQEQAIAAQVSELLSSSPDFKAVISSNAQVINAMPEHIEKMMLEIDDAPAATYALAKEGRLGALYSMPPHIAAAHLVQAEIRGQQYLQQPATPKTQTTPQPPQQQAPKPIGSIKGSGKSSKSLKDLTPDEIVRRFVK